MDHNKTDEVFRVQGADPPVPVRRLSVRVGSTGSSTCDRSAPLAGNQARGGYKATGKEGISTVLLKLKSVTSGRERANSLPEAGVKRLRLPWEDDQEEEGVQAAKNVSVTDLRWDGEVGHSVKKLREDSSTKRSTTDRRDSIGKTKSKLTAKAVDLIKKVDKEMRTLRSIIRENKNTKVEIKETVGVMTSMMSQLTAREMLDNLEESETSREIIVIDEGSDEGARYVGDREVRHNEGQCEEMHKRLEDEVKELKKEVERLKEENRKILVKARTATHNKGREMENTTCL